MPGGSVPWRRCLSSESTVPKGLKPMWGNRYNLLQEPDINHCSIIFAFTFKLLHTDSSLQQPHCCEVNYNK